jgi:hypothetical protein
MKNNQDKGTGLQEGRPAMEIEFMWKTGDSNTGNCPARYKVTSAQGGYVIQGKRLDAATRDRLRDLGDDEDGVWVPADVIDGLA